MVFRGFPFQPKVTSLVAGPIPLLWSLPVSRPGSKVALRNPTGWLKTAALREGLVPPGSAHRGPVRASDVGPALSPALMLTPC